jgi:hypothetical protein
MPIIGSSYLTAASREFRGSAAEIAIPVVRSSPVVEVVADAIHAGFDPPGRGWVDANRADAALVRFAMSVSEPSGSRMRHIPRENDPPRSFGPGRNVRRGTARAFKCEGRISPQPK